jgi:hypothetical protein
LVNLIVTIPDTQQELREHFLLQHNCVEGVAVAGKVSERWREKKLGFKMSS